MNATLIYIIFINALLVFKLWWDWKSKKSGRIINHTKSAMVDGLLYIIASVLCFTIVRNLSFWVAIGAVIIAASYRWIAFDAIFAKINWGTWDKHGTSSKIDVWLVKQGRYHFFIKLIPIAIGIAAMYTPEIIKLIEEIWQSLS